jgi:predicted nuclease of restriction endonuclease-like (RecB) superfamily
MTKSVQSNSFGLQLPSDYKSFLKGLKERIQEARLRANLAVNQELLLLYYGIGLDLDIKTTKANWGTSVIDQLSNDLHAAFPDMEGFSPRNLRRMRSFYRAYPLDKKSLELWPRTVAKTELIKWPPAVAKLTWAHNTILIEKMKDRAVREWYAQQAIEHGWSRDILALQIDSHVHERRGKALSNFNRVLPPPHSDLAQQITKDPYQFDFLSLSKDFHERDVENGLIAHLKDFLVELGVGFAYLGNQVHLTVGKNDYFLDLLFYHVKLRCYIVIEIKAGPFKPEFAGKLNFYLSAVDDSFRHPDDKPSIGLLLCRSKDKVDVEYALRDINKPIGIANWETKIVKSLPKEFKGSLPTVKELEQEFIAKRKSIQGAPRNRKSAR